MNAILKDYSWEMDGYALHASQAEAGKLTMYDAHVAYRLNPEPPELQPDRRADDYIRLAQETHELKYVFFYLHENEEYFNSRISRFLGSDSEEISPYRFMDMKLECRETVLRRFAAFDPEKGTTFLTYIHRYITDTLLRMRMKEEYFSFDSLQEYKDVRRIMKVYRACGENAEEAIRVFAEQDGCTEKTAREKLDAAWRQRNRLMPTDDEHDDEEPEQEDELIPDTWDYASILWNGMEAEAMDKAFRRLSYQDQTLLEQRNAICMNCGRVSSMSTRLSFETLAALFEGSGASGAEKAYKRAVENLLLNLVEIGQLHCVRLRQKSVQREGRKTTAAVYEYQVDNGGEWGEIQFDLLKKNAWVEVFAEKDLCNSWEITDCAIRAVLEAETLVKRMLVPIKMNFGCENI